MVLITPSCTVSQTSVHSSSGTVSDLIPWIYLSLPLYSQSWGIWFKSYLNGLVVSPTFFNVRLTFAIRSSSSELPGKHLSNRQIWPWSTEWSRAEANRVLPRERTGHSKHPLPTTQEKILHIDITRWSTPKSDWLYSLQPKMEKLYTVSKNKTGNWLWLRSWTPYCQIQT